MLNLDIRVNGDHPQAEQNMQISLFRLVGGVSSRKRPDPPFEFLVNINVNLRVKTASEANRTIFVVGWI